MARTMHTTLPNKSTERQRRTSSRKKASTVDIKQRPTNGHIAKTRSRTTRVKHQYTPPTKNRTSTPAKRTSALANTSTKRDSKGTPAKKVNATPVNRSDGDGYRRPCKRASNTIADKNRYVSDYYHKQDKNRSYLIEGKEVTLEHRVLGKRAKLALLRRNGIGVHTRHCNELLHKESDRFLKRLAKETVRSMHLFLLNKRYKNEQTFRIMPKHLRHGLELMNYNYML